MRGIKEVKDWSVPAPLLRILTGFPLDIGVHGPSEFEDCDLLFLDVEGKPGEAMTVSSLLSPPPKNVEEEDGGPPRIMRKYGGS
jgi:hypothetical protein